MIFFSLQCLSGPTTNVFCLVVGEWVYEIPPILFFIFCIYIYIYTSGGNITADNLDLEFTL